VAGALAGEDCGKILTQYLSLLHIPGNQVSRSPPERAHIFPSLPFIIDVPTEAFLVALDVAGQIYSYQSFSFPSLNCGCSDNPSVMLPHKPVSGNRKCPVARTWNCEERRRRKKNQHPKPLKVSYTVMCLGKFRKALVARLAFREPFF